ncbi:hypothetical protein DL98DRAFT_655586 [Cadophora sp. DSE1049]|nr:hypothetical protein DL98DRAFT_655586 [Cadophora sp. DSE1049]
MVSLSSESVQKLALLRFRATGTGVKIVTFFQSYAYDPHDPLEPCRFEALCRLKSIAEFSSSIPEYVPPSPDGKDIATTLDLLNDWLLVSSEILDEIQTLNPEDLSPIGARMVDFLSQVMQPHTSIDSLLPSKLNKPSPIAPQQSQKDKVQTVLDWFEDCNAWILDIKNDLEQSWLREDVLNDIPLPEIYTPLNTFLFAPAVHFIQWLLYYWRRNATTTYALPFEQTAIAPYTPNYLVPFRQYCQNPHLTLSAHALSFWKASRYPVRGSWGSAEIHDTVCNLLEENIQIAHQRIFNHGVMMNAQLSQAHLASSVCGSSSSSSPFSSPEPPTPRLQPQFLRLDMRTSDVSADEQNPFSVALSLSSASNESETLTYTCTFCSSPSYFTLAKDLKRHVDSIHSRPKFYCEVESCSRSKGKGRPFNRMDNLVRHVRSRHGKQVDRYSLNNGREGSL